MESTKSCRKIGIHFFPDIQHKRGYEYMCIYIASSKELLVYKCYFFTPVPHICFLMDNTEGYNGMMPSYVNNPSTTTSSVIGQSYSRDATNMVLNMVQQMQYIVKDNQELKESIRLNNEELQKKYKELNTWKENMKKEKHLLRQNFEKARSVVMELRDRNAFLQAENTKLEVRLNKGDEDNSEIGDAENQAFPSQLKSKYLVTVEGLERQLKEALSGKETAEKMRKELEVTNLNLQRTVYNDQQRLNKLNRLEEENRALEMSCRSLMKQLEENKELRQIEEKKIQEVREQFLQVSQESKTYSLEVSSLKSMKQQLHRDLEEARGHINQLQESFKKSKQEIQHVQYEKSHEVSSLQKKISEKDRSLDELFNEYDKYRNDNDQLRVERTRLQSERDNLYARLLCAEESLHKKDRDLKDMSERGKNDLRQKDEEVRKLTEDSNFFKAQADVYKQDFLIEREDRQKMHEENERLRSSIEQLTGSPPVYR